MAWISRYGLPSVLNIRAFFLFMNEIQKTNTSVQVFKYNGVGITFKTGENLMMNATEMAKSFCKFPYDWFRLPSTNDFLRAFVKDFEKDRYEKISQRYAKISQREILEILSSYNLIFVQQGGNMQGTWMYDEIAIEFARWLSPEFSIWCNKRIKEILNGGSKYPMTSDEAIAYGYGKALEKINRQSNVIKKQGKRITALLSQLESEKDARRERLLLVSQTRKDDFASWLESESFSGTVSMKEIHRRYSDYCHSIGAQCPNSSVLGKVMVSLGQERVRRAEGFYYIFGSEPCHEN